ncbi:hypothetical protein [Pseudoalteromonas sp.]|uniref:hypothetical protein n=1 Tax=Pseudoalteromonas sp. TaxID=53249 RepID=UPI002355BDA5|nr:hypothetical protein [Pseudoalteromonas sp.]
MSNLKNLRRELKAWGRFWASHEYAQGFSSKSNVEKVADACKLGGMQFSSVPFEINVPADIDGLTRAIDALSVHERLVIVGKYIKKKKPAELAVWAHLPTAKSAEFWLLRAERALL